MTTETAAPNTLREQLSSVFDDVVKPETDTPAPVVDSAAAPEVADKTVEAKPEGRTAGRQRDDKGRLLPGKSEKPEAVTTETVVSQEVKAAKPRPDSWKKDYWDYWEKLDPKLQDYLHERESDFRKGVGTYKAEYDRLKPFGDAVTPYLQLWEQAGVSPDQAVRNMAETDRILRSGSKDEKLRLMAYMAQSYGVPMHEMLVQGEDGKVYFNQQYLGQTQQQPQQQGITPEQVEQIVQANIQRVAWLQQVKDFREAKDGNGSPLHPHVAEVEVTMAGLLRAGLAKDLPSAYDAALRMPQHAALFEAQQTAKRQAEEEAKKREAAAVAARARAGAVSVKSQSPTGAAAGEKTRKGLRDTIAEAMDAVESGRV